MKKDYKLKISGSVIDKSSTGNTLFVEPSSVAKHYEELQMLKISEQNEVYNILYTLSAFVLASAPVLQADLEMVERLDFIFSKGKLSLDMDATEPAINTDRTIKLWEARHPLMDPTIAVPLQFEVGGATRGIIITGPNTGGKTVAIKTVMLNCIMAQCGLHVTCKQADIVNARMEFNKETLRPTYQMVIGEAGESCAFYIADRLGMPSEMLKVAIRAAYGDDAVASYIFSNPQSKIRKSNQAKITKSKKGKNTTELSIKYQIGDSVMVYPDKKIGIVCVPINEKGVLRVQLPNKKIWINHKRVKLHVAATELYPEDYDFSIIFDTVENRKKRHDMERKYTDAMIELDAYSESF